MVSQAQLISKGSHSLFPGIIPIFVEKIWVPLKSCTRLCVLIDVYAMKPLFNYCVILSAHAVNINDLYLVDNI